VTSCLTGRGGRREHDNRPNAGRHGALTNVAKHSGAANCRVTVANGPGRLGLQIIDDGVGGAHAAKGHGLSGLTDRVRATGGTLTVVSPAGGPTEVGVDLPC
jgi:signal transduction histidine kinase